MDSGRRLFTVEIVIFGVAALVFLFWLIYPLFRTPGIAPVTDAHTSLTRRVTSDGAPILGDPDAPLTLVEFVDYACPHCATYRHTINEFITTQVVPGNAKLEIRILAGLDPTGSYLAARAALCAGEQNAFWEMHEALLEMQEQYGQRAFTEERVQLVADRLNLDSGELLACTTKPESYQEALQSNIDLALSIGVESTPSLLFREGSGRPMWIEQFGQPFTSGISLDVLNATVDSLLINRP